MLVYIVTVSEFYTSPKNMQSGVVCEKLLTVTQLSICTEWMVWSGTERGESVV